VHEVYLVGWSAEIAGELGVSLREGGPIRRQRNLREGPGRIMKEQKAAKVGSDWAIELARLMYEKQE
jgi:hypothetical protein